MAQKNILIPAEQRRFAVSVVRRLREAGFEAFWAGGCVRDQLLGRTPKDYDVATNAVPQKIREIFGYNRTLAIGAAFGVIAVVGPRTAGTIEVTTFRRDAPYSDGRHPDSVTFSSPEEDAARRDFTINGLFYDPLEEKVIDFVGGQEDIIAKRIRAIGNARLRFAEDKLRMLRAVRFAATFGFSLDAEIQQAISEMAQEITIVSPERIAMEMRRMLADRGRASGVRLLIETGLAQYILPEIVPRTDEDRLSLDRALVALERLGEDIEFPLVLAMVLYPFVDENAAAEVCRRWKLSNKETDRICWLVKHHGVLLNALKMRRSELQPVLIAEGANDLILLTEAAYPEYADATAFCRSLLALPPTVLNPPPLIDGNDLLAKGAAAGPQIREMLDRVRAAQLDGKIHTKAEALALLGFK